MKIQKKNILFFLGGGRVKGGRVVRGRGVGLGRVRVDGNKEVKLL